MGLYRVKTSDIFINQFFVTGYSPKRMFEITDGLPEDSKLVIAEVDHNDKNLVLYFETSTLVLGSVVDKNIVITDKEAKS